MKRSKLIKNIRELPLDEREKLINQERMINVASKAIDEAISNTKTYNSVEENVKLNLELKELITKYEKQLNEWYIQRIDLFKSKEYEKEAVLSFSSLYLYRVIKDLKKLI